MKIEQWIAIALCVLMLPIAYADEDEDNDFESEEEIEVESDENHSKIKLKGKVRLQDRKDMDDDDDRKEKQRRMGLGLKLGHQIRMIAASDKARLKAMIMDAKEDFKVRHKAAIELKKQFHEERKKLRDCDTNCTELEGEVKVAAGAYLGNSADAMISVLQKAKARLSENEYLSAEQVANLTASIDAKIVIIQNASARAQAANATKEDIRSAAREMSAAWKEARMELSAHNLLELQGRVSVVIMQADKLRDRLNATLTRMENQGRDASTAAELMTEFEAHLLSAETHYNASMTATTKEDVKDQLKEAREELKEAHKTLREIVSLIKKTGVRIDVNATAAANASA